MMKRIIAQIDDGLYTELQRRGKFDERFDDFVSKALRDLLREEDKEAAR